MIIQMEQYTQLIEDYQLLVPFRPKIAGIRYVVCRFLVPASSAVNLQGKAGAES